MRAESLQSCPTLCDPMDYIACQAPLCPWDSPGKNTGVGCHVLLQRIFPAQGLNPGLLSLLQWQVDSLLLSHQGKPWSAYVCIYTHIFPKIQKDSKRKGKSPLLYPQYFSLKPNKTQKTLLIFSLLSYQNFKIEIT